MTALCSFFARRRILASYFYDLLLIGVLFLPYFLIFTIAPFERVVWRDDRSIMFPYHQTELIPPWALPIFAFVIPMILVTGWLGIKQFRNKRLLVSYIGLLLSLLIAIQVTTVLKALVGRPRPDFLARCDPDPAILNKVVCRGAQKLVEEGRRSFPSGHSSTSFAGLGYSGFFLAGQLGLFDGEGHAYKLIISLLPFLIAGFVGVTRIMDYRHHWQDVLAGAILGTVAAYLSYRMYFPSIMQQRSDSPLGERFSKYEEPQQTSPGKTDESQQISPGKTDRAQISGADFV